MVMGSKTRRMISRDRRVTEDSDSDSDNEEKQGGTKTNVPLLTDQNYVLWRVKMRNYLMMKTAWDVVCIEPVLNVATSGTLLTDSQRRENRKQKDKMSRAYGIIMQHLRPAMSETLYNTPNVATPYQLWTKITDLNMNNAALKIKDLVMQFATFTWKGNSVHGNFNRFNWILVEMMLLGVNKPPSEEISRFVACTPTCYETIVLTILSDPSVTTIQDAVAILSIKERRIKMANKRRSQSRAMTSNAQRSQRPQKPAGKGIWSNQEDGLVLYNCYKYKNHTE